MSKDEPRVINGLNLWETISKINATLEAGEPDNISIDPHTTYIGYEPQATIDAVNEHLGPELWRYEEVLECPSEAGSKEWEFKGLLLLRIDGEWITKGTQVGGGRIERSVVDGKKAARTDFLKKAFAAWSVGSRAYRGLLQAGPPVPNQQSKQLDTKPAPQGDDLFCGAHNTPFQHHANAQGGEWWSHQLPGGKWCNYREPKAELKVDSPKAGVGALSSPAPASLTQRLTAQAVAKGATVISSDISRGIFVARCKSMGYKTTIADVETWDEEAICKKLGIEPQPGAIDVYKQQNNLTYTAILEKLKK